MASVTSGTSSSDPERAPADHILTSQTAIWSLNLSPVLKLATEHVNRFNGLPTPLKLGTPAQTVERAGPLRIIGLKAGDNLCTVPSL